MMQSRHILNVFLCIFFKKALNTINWICLKSIYMYMFGLKRIFMWKIRYGENVKEVAQLAY